MDCQYVLKSSQPKVPLCFCYPNPPFSAVLEGVAFPLNCWNLHKIAGLCCKRSFFRRATCNAWETGNLTNRFEGQRIRDQSNTSNSLDKSWSIAKHTRLTSAGSTTPSCKIPSTSISFIQSSYSMRLLPEIPVVPVSAPKFSSDPPPSCNQTFHGQRQDPSCSIQTPYQDIMGYG